MYQCQVLGLVLNIRSLVFSLARAAFNSWTRINSPRLLWNLMARFIRRIRLDISWAVIWLSFASGKALDNSLANLPHGVFFRLLFCAVDPATQ